MDITAVAEALDRWLPGAVSSARSFAHALPDPRDLSPAARLKVLEEGRRAASIQLKKDLVAAACHGILFEPRHGLAGEPIWPNGFVGSVSHDGAAIAGVVAPATHYSAIGIDLARKRGADSRLAGLFPESGVPESSGEDAYGLAFCSKEAAFKACYPLHREVLGLDDMTLAWQEGGSGALRAVARCGHGERFQIAAAVTGPWFLAAAFQPTDVMNSNAEGGI